ncbi:CPBP family intramembrane glutamic endopeptidase [uncultured Algibacter sp.]|uniref:CPBP family intramembrane glutamic endopeptidase n=1 Tax=uncultured Algibacter sp. TaxID=298659 RepID=UPI00261BAA64|nr:CPBP family intramembrane glutamic endopeptidase [uncultured Algibacter sp.]
MSYSQILWVFIGVSFLTYFLISLVYKSLNIQNLEKALLSSNGLRLLNLKHILGIIFFGVLFNIIAPELRFLFLGIEIPKLHILLLILIVIFLSAYISYKAITNKQIENLASGYFSFPRICWYFIIRFFFLFCYEFFFRGVLLFELLELTSLFYAITANTLLYVIIHIFDSKNEILGAIPFGIILCLSAYFTNSIWYAFFIHLTLSAVYEISMFYYLTLKTSKS